MAGLPPASCPHIAAVFQNDPSLLTKYRTVVAWNIRQIENLKRPHKRRKIAAPACGTCQITLVRPFVCLHCSYAGCWTSEHIQSHLKDSKHVFGADIKSGAVFCAECDEIVYDKQVHTIYTLAVVAAEEKETRTQNAGNVRQPYRPWIPNPEEEAALKNSVPIPCQARRGLLNLGQTCYLNVIVQAFVHNPHLQSYFLSDRHHHKLCKQPPDTDCTCCEMDKLFAEIYTSTPNSPAFGPTSLLYTTWRFSAAASSELSGYAQQDAHEFFISLLNQLHAKSRGSTNVSCNCIVHSTFAGKLQSDVTCGKCGNVSSTVDDFLDVSLQLKGGKSSTVDEDTLGACLRRFTQPEKLGTKEYTCDKCGKASHEANKRLSIRKLPPVLSFQFKRFEHQTNDMTAPRKIETSIRIPSTLNMAPFTSVVQQQQKENVAEAVYTGAPDSIYEYDLFAVVNHEGNLNNGHYTNFARSGDEWYHFDDDKVTPSTLGACLKSMVYMCFYVRKRIEYKPISVPTYVRARECAAVKELEMKEKELKAKERVVAERNREVEDALMSIV